MDLNGTVIHGTHRPQDLIPAFFYELEAVEPQRAAPFWSFLEDFNKMSTDDQFWLIDNLVDQLNFAAPDGFYFGAHPGDGSDFGWWSCEIDF